MKSKLNEYLKFALLIKRFTAGYADVLIELLTRSKTYGQSARAICAYLREVLDRLQRNTLLSQLTLTGIGCELQLPAYNRPLTFFASLSGHWFIRLMFSEDTFFGNRWLFNSTIGEEFGRTLSITFDQTGDHFHLSNVSGVLQSTSSDGILSEFLPLVKKQKSIFSHGTSGVDSVPKPVGRKKCIMRSLVSQALAHRAMRLPLNFVYYIGSEHDFFSEPVVEFALKETPSEENRLVLKILGQELVDQLSYVSSAVRSRTNTHLFPVVASTLLHTHEIRRELGNFIDYVNRNFTADSSWDQYLRRFHSDVLDRVSRIEDETLREIDTSYVLGASDIAKSLRELLQRQTQDVSVEEDEERKIVAPLSPRSIAELVFPFVDNAISASRAQPFISEERQKLLASLGVLSHCCVIKIYTTEQYASGGGWSLGTQNTPYVNRPYVESDGLLQIEIYDRGPGISADVLEDLATGTTGTRLPTTHLAGGRGIANTLLYLRSIPNSEYAYTGFWTIKIRCLSADKAKEVYGASFRGAEEIFSKLSTLKKSP